MLRANRQWLASSNSQRNDLIVQLWCSDNLAIIVVVSLGVAYFSQNMFLFDTPMSYVFFFVSLALTHHFIVQARSVGSENWLRSTFTVKPCNDSTVSPWIGRVVLPAGTLFVLACFIWINWQAYQASYWGRMGLGSETAAQAEEAYSKALAFNGYPKAEVLQAMTDTLLTNNRVGTREWSGLFYMTVNSMEALLGSQGESADPRLYIRLGIMYTRRAVLGTQYLQDGFRVLRKAVALAPRRPEAYYALGANLLQRGDNEEAKRMFAKAVALDPRKH
ncbi:MAG: tetratricopeptide repeat protein [Gammaproteobacteria bacterium]|nr:tetratricopeptide repeat protein [Gammaproteobacteria bacterium]